MKDYIFTSESITEGHPDKICDKIADSILDEALRQDPYSNMAVEATIKDDFVLIYGEADTSAHIDYAKIAKDVIRKIGYEEEYTVMTKVNKQSSEIHNAVNHADHVIGAGDQGIMFGYACNESDEYMPAPIYYAHKLARQLTKVRRENPLLKPDGKTQVSVEYKEGKIARIDTIVVSTQHAAEATQEQIHEIVMNEVILPCIEPELIDERTRFLINPSGSFVVGGSFGDSGTTGRKIVCDTYGGMGRIGGRVADFAHLMGMRVLYTARTPKPERDALGDTRVSLEDLMKNSDFITLHCPHTPQTEGMISREMIALMKPTAYLINTARGPVVDEDALIEALRAHRIAGAALDVFASEPDINPAFAALDNVLLTPHAGSNTLHARNEMARAASRRILDRLAGRIPQNLLNPEALAHAKA